MLLVKAIFERLTRDQKLNTIVIINFRPSNQFRGETTIGVRGGRLLSKLTIRKVPPPHPFKKGAQNIL